MRRVVLRVCLLAGLVGIAPPQSRADKLILIPTAELSGYSAEYVDRTRGADEGIATVTFPTGPLVEALLRYNRNFDRSHNLELGGMIQLLPQVFGTPAVGVGVWDISNSGPAGRRFFLVLSQEFAREDFIPAPLRDLQVTAGIGTGRLGGPFVGLRAGVARGIYLVGEWDSRRLNAGLWWTPVRGLTLKGELHNGQPFIGARFQAGL